VELSFNTIILQKIKFFNNKLTVQLLFFVLIRIQMKKMGANNEIVLIEVIEFLYLFALVCFIWINFKYNLHKYIFIYINIYLYKYIRYIKLICFSVCTNV